MNDLPTLDQAEDAAANALARLILDGMDHRGGTDRPLVETLRLVCRELLRGPLDEVGGSMYRRPGGYCLKAPTDPALRALGVFGARVVEMSYTAHPDEALDLATSLWEALKEDVL